MVKKGIDKTQKLKSFRDFGNPFTVQSPEDMIAKDAFDLFDDVFSDFPKVLVEGHVFLDGPRGCGKSMMFRYMQPDCQRIKKHCDLKKLDFYAFWIQVKNTQLRITELKRLEKHHADTVLNEHFMVMQFAERICYSLLQHEVSEKQDSLRAVKNLAKDNFYESLKDCGWSGTLPNITKFKSIHDCLSQMQKECISQIKGIIRYLRRLPFAKDPIPYDGPLCGYLDFLFPLLCGIGNLPFMPKGPIYMLVDDADNLSETQTRILNTWVSSRTSRKVSIKISTQMGYKTYQTTTQQLIETPHDYSEVNIATIYTTSFKNKYKDRIDRIVEKRLDLFYGIKIKSKNFFPPDFEQEEKIKSIGKRYREEWNTSGRGYRPSDDALRYARPDFIKNLAGASKSTPSYSYAGFEQLVHISSGIIRYFLEAASQMYSEMQAKNGNKLKCIAPNIQDKVVREQAEKFLFNELDKLIQEYTEESPGRDRVKNLANLLHALGGVFRAILISDRSERRVFSIAFSDEPSADILDLLNLGVELGYFHLSSIGNKEGTGRTRLFILNRRLAPFFKLDPTGFASYLFVTNDKIRKAIEQPYSLLNRVKEKGIEDVFEEPRQLKLFDA